MMFAKHGHIEAAKELIAMFPESGKTTNSFGISADALIEAHGMGRALPPGVEAPAAMRANGASLTLAHGSGGWPVSEIEFPGWDGECDFAELSGEAVAANPKRFFEEFILKDRPAVLRDFVRFDEVSDDKARAKRFSSRKSFSFGFGS